MPHVRVGEHPLDFRGRDEGAEFESVGAAAVAIGFGSSQGDTVPTGPQRAPQADVREDVSVGADGREDGVHSSSFYDGRGLPGQDGWTDKKSSS